MLSEYNQKHPGIVLNNDQDNYSKNCAATDDQAQGPKKQNCKKQKCATSEQTFAAVKLSSNLTRLENILDASRLKLELRELQDFQMQSSGKWFYKNISTTSAVSTWMQQNKMHNVLEGITALLPEHSCTVTGVYFLRMQKSVQILPGLTASIKQMAFITCAQCWCRHSQQSDSNSPSKWV